MFFHQTNSLSPCILPHQNSKTNPRQFWKQFFLLNKWFKNILAKFHLNSVGRCMSVNIKPVHSHSKFYFTFRQRRKHLSTCTAFSDTISTRFDHLLGDNNATFIYNTLTQLKIISLSTLQNWMFVYNVRIKTKN